MTTGPSADGSALAGELARAYRQFSCPHESRDEGVVETIAAGYCNAVVGGFLDCRRDALLERSRGLVEVLDGWLRHGEDDAETAWDPSFGLSERATHEDMDPVVVAAGVALRIAAAGVPGRWSATWSEPCRLLWGNLCLPPARRLEVDCDGQVGLMTIGGGDDERRVRLERGPGGWTGDELEPLPRVGRGDRIMLLSRATAPAGLVDDGALAGLESVAELERPAVESLQRALTLLAERSPRYYQWVERALRVVVICRNTGSGSQSGSWMDIPRGIYLSWSEDPMQVAEALVHECSHQYLHLLSRVEPVDDGTDLRLYYSPSTRRERPLGRVLTAYHAFANVLLFHREARRDGVVGRGEAQAADFVAQLDGPLRASSALTAVGRALYEPLQQRLDHAKER